MIYVGSPIRLFTFGLLRFGLQRRLDYSNWTTYDVSTIAVSTTSQIDYTVIWTTSVKTVLLDSLFSLQSFYSFMDLT